MSDVLPGTTLKPIAPLDWRNVGLAFSFILFNITLSTYIGLGVGGALFTSAVRCVAQLGVVAVLLQRVFATNNPWLVAGIALVLNLLGTFEIVFNKSKRRHDYMFQSVLIGMLGSTIPVSIVGVKLAMSVEPFWKPIQYIPVLGMVCGFTISGIVVAVSYTLKELQENRDKVETYLAFGASRREACRPIVQDALRLALTPVIDYMSVTGIISIPGMMTGAILGGSSVQQAAKLQMIIIFMLSSSTSLAVIFTTLSVISVAVDAEHRIRIDRIDDKTHVVWRWRSSLCRIVVNRIRMAWYSLTRSSRKRGLPPARDEQIALLRLA